MTIKNLITTLAGLGLALAPFTAALSQITTPSSTKKADLFPYAPVSADMVKEAGFTGVQTVNTGTNRFQLPTYYFTAKETIITGRDAWGDAANLIAVLIQPVEDQKWVFNQGDIQTTELSGRFQAAVSSPGYFISVTGPDKNKVITLAHTLKVLY